MCQGKEDKNACVLLGKLRNLWQAFAIHFLKEAMHPCASRFCSTVQYETLKSNVVGLMVFSMSRQQVV